MTPQQHDWLVVAIIGALIIVAIVLSDIFLT